MMSDTTAAAPTTPIASRLFTGFLVVACIALSVLVVVLTKQNADLRAHFAEAAERGSANSLAVGDRLEPLPTFGADAASASALAFGDGRFGTVIFAVSATCPACVASSPYFERVNAAHASDAVRVVCAQLDSKTAAELTAHGAGVPVVGVTEGHKTWFTRVRMVPATIVIDHEGAVRATYFGELSARQQDDLDALLKQAANGWK